MAAGGRYCCYWCPFEASELNPILLHSSTTHEKTQKFSFRKKILDDIAGIFVWKSIHFSITLQDLNTKLTNGFIPIIRETDNKISFKRPVPNEVDKTPISVELEESREFEEETGVHTQTNYRDIYEIIPQVIAKLETLDRLDDFRSLLAAIGNGFLNENIAFHLLLDIGQFFSKCTITEMRYSNESLQFWSTVKNLFKGKGINFFRGYKAHGLDGYVKPSDCKINFIVPSDYILRKECAHYTSESKEPGIMQTSLECFSKEHSGKAVKISVDGKKLASGLGVLGDENLCGYEAPPTLSTRKMRLSAELDRMHKMQTLIEEKAVDECTKINKLCNKSGMKKALLIIMSNLSLRIQELRELVVKKNIALANLLKQVEGDWKTSKVAPAISYCKTKIVHATTTVKELLKSVDGLGYVVSCINGTDKDYVYGSQTEVHFNHQPNFICLKESNSSTDPHLTKQRTKAWFDLREKSRITGSTMFKGLGLGLLKEQQEHYDRVFNGKQQIVSPETQELFDYGTKQEINALATLLGKIIPVYYPHLQFVEDGCETISLGDSYAVISGDGSGVDISREPEVAFEFKCPRPGKTRTTDLHYTLPIYYTTQLLSQMAAKSCNKFGYVSYTPESASFITGQHERELWEKLFSIATDLYGSSSASRPVRIPPHKQEVLEKLKEYANTCSFVAEFPSLLGIPCSCSSSDDNLDVHGYHTRSTTKDSAISSQSLDDIASLIQSSTSVLKEAYEILRRPAKEILVTVISDLDRTITLNDVTCHAVPVHYALAGYSLPMTAVRSIMKDLLQEISKTGMNLKVIAFDGQFLEIAVAEECGRPLTLCRFMKYFWANVQKMEKRKKLSALLQLNHIPNIQNEQDLRNHFTIWRQGCTIHISSKAGMKTVVLSPFNITKSLETRDPVKPTTEHEENDKEQNNAELDILALLPSDIVDKLDEDVLRVLQKAKATVLDSDDPERLTTCEEIVPVPAHNIEFDKQGTRSEQEDIQDMSQSQETDFEILLVALIASSEHSRWATVSLDAFKNLFDDAKKINTSFTVSELKAILSLSQDKQKYSKMLKPQLVNLVSKLHGNGSFLAINKKPKCLKLLCITAIKKWNVHGLNVAYAQYAFPDALSDWERDNDFEGEWTIETETGNKYTLSKWYAQPAHIDGQAFQPIIDPHHLFVNNRARCCSKGMERMHIKKEAWWKVAEDSKLNGTGLSLEIAKDIRDRQRNSFAQVTFCEKVEVEMQKVGNCREANWCRLIRQWYKAIDEGAIDVDQRIQWLMNIREYLLKFLKVGHFPPPGSFVADLPIAQFEGILTNVDRRLQLYAMIDGASYNQRAVTSLDSETFFSAFQEYDPKGTGILRPDDIPVAMGTAVSLFKQRLDSRRLFYMKTSGKQRVYPQNVIPQSVTRNLETEVAKTQKERHIVIRAHMFDKPERLSKIPRRKSGTISRFGTSGKGAEGVRSHHRVNEEKILAHRRFGLTDSDIDE